MLVLIAVANVPYFIWGRPHGIGAHAAGGSPADLVAQTIAIIGIDSRVYPMFAFLFGYGIVQLYGRQTAAGTEPKDARRLLRRRHWWMLIFGLVHALLLWYADILGTYAIAGLVLVWLFLNRKDRTIKVWAGLFVAVPALASVVTIVGAALGSASTPSTGGVGAGGPLDANGIPGYFDAMGARLEGWAVYTIPTALFAMIVPASILLGMVAARHRVLDSPADHVRLLKRTAAIGLTVGWGSGLLLALQNLGALGSHRELDWALLPMHMLGGLFGGLGYVAVFGLIAVRLEHTRDSQRTGSFPWAVQALGKRSLSGYLFQSLVYSPLLAAWGLGLGQHLSSWSAALLAVGVWLGSLLIAARLERDGRRGPAEWLLRRLAYPGENPSRQPDRNLGRGSASTPVGCTRQEPAPAATDGRVV
ncbi:Uncharacterized membrane protein YeiB [Saccharopolyspora shandongensis]|uniref:Uncharacterized membrane protein YeiB n=1 Tax=Saccharopolyspora shandongensis TaxID=418495 RepID=A0A1H3MRK6_9PSEU|nr:DUF418 domain-containing protein [Saccharopolyspora shandongensis]SDY78815.1 Uncharacterized membrane protein YeiB [Saccharopolyspora shandongensis]